MKLLMNSKTFSKSISLDKMPEFIAWLKLLPNEMVGLFTPFQMCRTGEDNNLLGCMEDIDEASILLETVVKIFVRKMSQVRLPNGFTLLENYVLKNGKFAYEGAEYKAFSALESRFNLFCEWYKGIDLTKPNIEKETINVRDEVYHKVFYSYADMLERNELDKHIKESLQDEQIDIWKKLSRSVTIEVDDFVEDGKIKVVAGKNDELIEDFTFEEGDVCNGN